MRGNPYTMYQRDDECPYRKMERLKREIDLALDNKDCNSFYRLAHEVNNLKDKLKNNR